ncbi:Cytochrome P450 71D2, partial [Linum perenne]
IGFREALKKAQEEVRQVFGNSGSSVVKEEGFDELCFLKLVIKEALRLHPPASLLLPRQNSEACKIDGYDIPAKTKVIVNAWAMGRDTKHWKEPNGFILERFVDDEDCYSANYKRTDLPINSNKTLLPNKPRKLDSKSQINSAILKLRITNLLERSSDSLLASSTASSATPNNKHGQTP